MDSRHTAFVAAPFGQAIYRRRVTETLSDLGVRVVELADGVPRPMEPAETIRTKLDGVDFVVVLVGQHPGSFLAGDPGLTYTALELRLSLLADLPIVALLIHDDARIGFGTTVQDGASAEALRWIRQTASRFCTPSFFRATDEVELQLRKAYAEWVEDEVAKRQAIRRIQIAHMASEPSLSNVPHSRFSCTVELHQRPQRISRENSEALGLSPDHVECFCPVSGLGHDWIYFPDVVWRAAAVTTFPALVRGRSRCVGRSSDLRSYQDVGGFAMDEFVASC